MITSVTNDKVKYIRRVQADKRFRQREGVFIVEGTRWLTELIQFGYPVQSVMVTVAWLEVAGHEPLMRQLTAPYYVVSETVMQGMSDTENAPGVLVVAGTRPLPLPPIPSLLLILDGVTNPGNLGTMLRTAAAAGVEAVLLAPGCVEPYNPKVIRGGMGAHLRLPIHNLSWAEIEAQTAGLAIWLADIGVGAELYTAVNWQRPSALIIGNEAQGISHDATKMAHGRVTIPMHAATESLNAAIAAGIILFEAARQRAQLLTFPVQ